MFRKKKIGERSTKRVRRAFAAGLLLLSLCTVLCGAGSGTAAETAVPAAAETERLLYPGGMLFGVRCTTEGVLVAGLENVSGNSCPARDAGVCEGDIIREADGREVTSVRALADTFASDTAGEAVLLTLERGGNERTVSVTPLCAPDGVMRAGIRLRDSAAGIGTVTFIEPETNLFGGLGHGICDVDTGVLLPLARGTTLNVRVSEIVRGAVGVPGELRGCFTSKRTGTLSDNTDCGVFGLFSELPENAGTEAVPAGHPEDVHEGEAFIRCTLDETGPQTYAVRIVRLTHELSPTAKNFVVEVTDPVLLEKTGGIVQGMSGSPVMQDGKLVGAVTHVLLNNPERGFGIFLDNMLHASAFGAAA